RAPPPLGQRPAALSIRRASSTLRRYDALILFGNRAHSPVDEALHALTAVGFRRVDVAFRICRDAVNAVELAGLSPAFAEARQHFERLAKNHVHAIVLAVGEVQIPLLRIAG